MSAKPKAEVKQQGQIEAKKLKTLANSWESTRDEVSELSGDLGSQIRLAIKEEGLHRRAFRAVMAERKMEAEKLAEFYEALDFYREVLGLVERAASAPKFEVLEGGKDI